MGQHIKPKRTAKDSVFTDLFGDVKYQLQLYRALHPDDTDVTEADIQTITIQNVLVNGLYNDLGILVRDRLIVLVEAQTTWSENIVIRAGLYLMHTYKEYFSERKCNLYSSKKVFIPRAELYVIYTGGGKDELDGKTISLTENFFDGIPCGIDVSAKIICDRNRGDIAGEYIRFCVILTDQLRQCGRTEDAIRRTIDICIHTDNLKDYLAKRQKEVVSMTVQLYDEDMFFDFYVNEVVQEATAKATEKAIAQGLEQGMAQGIAQGIAQGMSQGQEKGRQEGLYEAISGLVRDGLLSLHDGAARLGIPEAALSQRLSSPS